MSAACLFQPPTHLSLDPWSLVLASSPFILCFSISFPHSALTTSPDVSWISQSWIFTLISPKASSLTPFPFLILSATIENGSPNPLLWNDLTSTENQLNLKYLFMNDPCAYIHLSSFTPCGPSSTEKSVITLNDCVQASTLLPSKTVPLFWCMAYLRDLSHQIT